MSRRSPASYSAAVECLHVLARYFATCLPCWDDKKASAQLSPVLLVVLSTPATPHGLSSRASTVASGCCKPPLTLLVGSTRPRPLPPINRSCAAEAATMSSPIAYLQ
ncbi:hypothetical protein IG631_12145 [Alternaria alternata]|nr:hypothetical protein IG631_12145 [Alternaria alternata]